MEQVIDGLLYDTEKSELIIKSCITSVWKTKNGRYFLTDELTGNMEVNPNKVKQLLGRYHPDIYIELFGEVEEA